MRDLNAPRAFAPAAWVPALLAVWLFALPLRGTVAVRNVLLGSAVALILIAAWRGRAWRALLPPRPLLAVLLAWAAWGVASVGWSVVPGSTISELRPELATPLAAFFAFHAATDRASRIDLWSFALACALAALALLAIVPMAAKGTWDPHRWHVDVGYYTTFVVLALPWLAWLAWRRRGAAVRIALAATVGATLLVTWWTDNRVVWPTIAAMVTVAAALAARDAPPGQRLGWIAVAALALAGAAALFAAAHQERAEMLRRVDSPVGADFATDPRLTIWPQAFERWRERPILGLGFGRPALAMATRPADGIQDARTWHAHNVFLDVALQLGVVGLAIFVAGLALLARELARGLGGGPARRVVAIVGLAVAVGFLGKNFPDDFVVRHILLLCAAIAGILAAAMREAFDATS